MPRQPQISELESHLGYWLRYVSNHVSGAFQRKVESTGVTVAEWAAMRKLYAPGIASPSALAEAMGMTRGAVSKLLDRLVRKGLAVRETSTTDKRYQHIALTPEGRKRVPELARLADENEAAFFSHLAPAERETLLALLKQTVQVHGLREIPLE